MKSISRYSTGMNELSGNKFRDLDDLEELLTLENQVT